MYLSKPISTVGKGSEISCLNTANFSKRFRGVVGYHIRLTRGRSPVRTRTKTNSFFFHEEIFIFYHTKLKVFFVIFKRILIKQM